MCSISCATFFIGPAGVGRAARGSWSAAVFVRHTCAMNPRLPQIRFVTWVAGNRTDNPGVTAESPPRLWSACGQRPSFCSPPTTVARAETEPFPSGCNRDRLLWRRRGKKLRNRWGNSRACLAHETSDPLAAILDVMIERLRSNRSASHVSQLRTEAAATSLPSTGSGSHRFARSLVEVGAQRCGFDVRPCCAVSFPDFTGAARYSAEPSFRKIVVAMDGCGGLDGSQWRN